MTAYSIKENILTHIQGDTYHLAPIPFIYAILDTPERDNMNRNIMIQAREYFEENIVEVPDVRHIDTMGVKRRFPEKTWKEFGKPAIGVWHSVPTNNILTRIDNEEINKLKAFIAEKHKEVMSYVQEEKYVNSIFMESWIQFYKNGDYKVLHNHERYERPFISNMWVGAYFLTDGKPDDDKKYSGLISFSVRGDNYYIRPKPGLLLMWPSDILHEVHPFYGKEERVVINFHIRNDSE